LATYFVLQMAAPVVKNLMVESNKMAKEGKFELIDILHHFTSGFKAIYTDYAYFGVDELRQACGGAGFTLASGIAQ
jgi:hypothetical protein